jgi:glucan phosphoethanolaminetransferase (alkaline phosphatase superfamily)
LQTNSPVQLIPFQLTFDANTVESYYEGFIHQNTFSQYITTQFIDFIWIFGLLATLFFAHVLIARAQQYSIKWRRIALLMAIIAPLVASSDIFENIVSFIMLANPTDISPFLAILHASFASIKWLWAVLGTSFLLTQVIILVIYKIKFNK